MRSANESRETRSLLLALGALAFAALCFGSANAQTAGGENAALLLQSQVAGKRSVGVTGRLRRVVWSAGSEKDLYDLRLLKTTRRLERVPGVMRNTKIWMARADICSPPGDEILLQIRGPLTCGSLGCEMMVLSEATGGPRVLLHTIGDTIDSPAMDSVVINQGSNRQRSWRYDNIGVFVRAGNR